MRLRKLTPRLHRWFAVPVLTLTGAFLVDAATLARAGLHDHVTHADVIVVPGNTVARDGTPSPRLQARLDAALWLYREGYARLVLVSGATGAEGFDEATVMAQYLVDHGVLEASIVKDSAGVNTDATAAHTAAMMRERHLRTALIATQYFHVPRTELALNQHGVDVVGSRHARFAERRDIYSLTREAVAVPVYLLRK
jgi:vancomycin permeability regulator SanA